ncbi:MAG: hypothetical protein AAF560_17400 [Acidobacteriota bacterium]
MRWTNLRGYLSLACLAFFVGLPIVKSFLQQASIGQDIRRIQLEYSMRGPHGFRARLDEIVERAPLDPKDVKIQMQENRREARVLVDVWYPSRMEILFFPIERQVHIREEIPLTPL